ncbi:unnamed protein product [Staurois parvus]|uniref:Uncharacterized protein n=1 Tax=Staurois parvus TaxID=386267 RepID=A0ABN9G363_9NEOB|nr:unnamed protein product [Staurois parvus]
MYINVQTGAVQGRVAIYKCPPCPLLVRVPCVLWTEWNTDHCRGPLCEVRSCDH